MTPPGYLDQLEDQGNVRVKVGKWMLVSSVITVLGVILIPVGFSRQNAEFDQCGDLGEPECGDPGLALIVSGAVFAGVGGFLLLTGGITYGVGKKKLKRAEQYRTNQGAWRVMPSASATRNGAALGLVGRF